jgi:hypothetical protein
VWPLSRGESTGKDIGELCAVWKLLQTCLRLIHKTEIEIKRITGTYHVEEPRNMRRKYLDQGTGQKLLGISLMK